MTTSSKKFSVGDRVVVTEPHLRHYGHVGVVVPDHDYLVVRLPDGRESPFGPHEIEHAPEAAGGPEEADVVTYLEDDLGLIIWRFPDGDEHGVGDDYPDALPASMAIRVATGRLR